MKKLFFGGSFFKIKIAEIFDESKICAKVYTWKIEA